MERLQFDNINSLEAQVSGLPKAQLETLHRGKAFKKSDDEDSGAYMNLNDVECDDPQADALNKHVAIVNTETDEIANVVSKRYDLVQHRKALDPIVDALKHIGRGVEGEIRKYQGGNSVVLKVKFDESFEVEGDSDYIQGFTVRNSFDRSSSLKLSGYVERVVCSNGMVLQESVAPTLKRKHFGRVKTEEEYKEWMEELLELSPQIKRTIEGMADDWIKIEHVEDALRHVGIPKSKAGEIAGRVEEMDRTETEVSRRGLYNAITNYITHDMEGDVALSTEQKYQKKAQKMVTKPVKELEVPIEDGE